MPDGRTYLARVMKPVVNVEETPGKVVGRNYARPGDYDQLVRASRSLMPRLPFPKGVYRFRTFEEADAWTEKHILQAALNKARAHPNAAT
jgi:hypothetical protein